MAGKIRVKARAKRGVVVLKALISHPMETGQRKDKKTGKTIPAHYIETLSIERNGSSISESNMSPAISKNPYVQIRFPGEKGDSIKVSYVDNKQQKNSATSRVR